MAINSLSGHSLDMYYSQSYFIAVKPFRAVPVSLG